MNQSTQQYLNWIYKFHYLTFSQLAFLLDISYLNITKKVNSLVNNKFLSFMQIDRIKYFELTREGYALLGLNPNNFKSSMLNQIFHKDLMVKVVANLIKKHYLEYSDILIEKEIKDFELYIKHKPDILIEKLKLVIECETTIKSPKAYKNIFSELKHLEQGGYKIFWIKNNDAIQNRLLKYNQDPNINISQTNMEIKIFKNNE